MLSLSANSIASATRSGHVNNRTNSSIRFYGRQDTAYVANSETSNCQFLDDNDFSISLWIKPTFYAGYAGTTGDSPGKPGDTMAIMNVVTLGVSNDDFFDIVFYGSALVGTAAYYITLVENNATDTYIVYSNNALESTLWGTWQHIVFTADRDGNGTMYFNGSSVVTADISGHQGDFATVGSDIGLELGNKAGNVYGFQGNMDDFAIWKDALLTADDVTSIYNGGRPNDLTQAASYDSDKSGKLSCYYRFNDMNPNLTFPRSTTADTSKDYSGVSYTGGSVLTINEKGTVGRACSDPSTPLNP